MDEQLQQQLWDYAYGLLSDDEAEELELRIGSEPDVARSYAEVRLKADMLAEACRIDEPQLALGEQVTPLSRSRGAAAGAGSARRASSGLRRGNWAVAAAASLIAVVALLGAPHRGSRIASVDGSQSPQRYTEITLPPTLEVGANNAIMVRSMNLQDQSEPTRLVYRILNDELRSQFESEPIQVPASGAVLETPRLDVGARFLEVRSLGAPSLRVPIQPVQESVTARLTHDKSSYRPGDTIRFRLQTLSRFSRQPQSVDATAELVNALGEQVAAIDVQTDDDGVAEAKLAAPADGGEYSIRSGNNDGRFKTIETPILVRANPVAEQYAYDLEFARDSYAAGDDVSANLRLYEEAAATPKLAAWAHVDGQRHPVNVDSTIDGETRFNFKLPERVAYEARLNIQASSGETGQTIVKTIPVVGADKQVVFLPEGGALVEGVTNRVFFVSRSLGGQWAYLRGELRDDRGGHVADVEVSHEGRGAFLFQPEPGRQYTVHPENGSQTFALPAATADGVALIADPSVFAIGEPIRFRALGAKIESELHALAECRGVTVGQKRWKSSGGAEGDSVRLDLSPNASGVIRVTVLQRTEQSWTPAAERLVYRRPSKRLQVAINQRVDSSKLAVLAELSVQDENGEPREAIVGARAEPLLASNSLRGKAPGMEAYFSLASELQDAREIEDINLALAPEDAQAEEYLELLLGADGWRRIGLLNELEEQLASSEALQSAPAVQFQQQLFQPPVTFDNRAVLQLAQPEATSADASSSTPWRSLALGLCIFGLFAILMMGLLRMADSRVCAPAFAVAAVVVVSASFIQVEPDSMIALAPESATTDSEVAPTMAAPNEAAETDRSGQLNKGFGSAMERDLADSEEALQMSEAQKESDDQVGQDVPAFGGKARPSDAPLADDAEQPRRFMRESNNKKDLAESAEQELLKKRDSKTQDDPKYATADGDKGDAKKMSLAADKGKHLRQADKAPKSGESRAESPREEAPEAEAPAVKQPGAEKPVAEKPTEARKSADASRAKSSDPAMRRRSATGGRAAPEMKRAVGAPPTPPAAADRNEKTVKNAVETSRDSARLQRSAAGEKAKAGNRGFSNAAPGESLKQNSRSRVVSPKREAAPGPESITESASERPTPARAKPGGFGGFGLGGGVRAGGAKDAEHFRTRSRGGQQASAQLDAIANENRSVAQAREAIAGKRLEELYFRQTVDLRMARGLNGADASRQYWMPKATTDADGKVVLTIPHPPGALAKRLVADVAGHGRLGDAEAVIPAQSGLLAALTLPSTMTYGDEVRAPLVLQNYLNRAVDVDVKVVGVENLEVDPADREFKVRIPAGDANVRRDIRVKAKENLTSGKLAYQIRTTEAVQTLEQNVRIQPRGYPVDQYYSGIVESQRNWTVEIPQNQPAEFSIKAYPSVIAELQEAMDSALIRSQVDPDAAAQVADLSLRYLADRRLPSVELTRSAKSALLSSRGVQATRPDDAENDPNKLADASPTGLADELDAVDWLAKLKDASEDERKKIVAEWRQRADALKLLNKTQRGRAADVAEDSRAAIVMKDKPELEGETRKAIEDLVANRQSDGGFGAPIDTLWTLRAITENDRTVHKVAPNSKIAIDVNGRNVASQPFDAQRVLNIDRLDRFARPGRNQLNLAIGDGNRAPFLGRLRTWAPNAPLQRSDIRVALQLSQLKAKLGDSIEIRLVVENRGEQPLPLVANVTLPGGLFLRSARLEELKRGGNVDNFESQASHVRFYWKAFKAGERRELVLDAVAGAAGRYTSTPASIYPQNDQSRPAFAAPTTIEIE